MIAHNCHLGRHNMLCSQVGIAGSSTTGDYVVLAGQVGVRDDVHIGSGSIVGAKGGIVNDVPDGSRYIGIPATPEREQKLQSGGGFQAAGDAAPVEGPRADGDAWRPRSPRWRKADESPGVPVQRQRNPKSE